MSVRNGSATSGKKESAARTKRAATALTPVEKWVLEDDHTKVESEADGADAARQIASGEAYAKGKAKGKGGNGPPMPDNKPLVQGGKKVGKASKEEPSGSNGTDLAVADKPLVPEVIEEGDATGEIRELTADEDEFLVQREADADESKRIFEEGGVAFGLALADIRDRGVYLKTHTSFNQYALDRFRVEPRSLLFIIGHARSVERLRLQGAEVLPDSQRTSRPLLMVYPEAQLEVWNRAVELADAEGKIPKARHVARAAEESGKRKPGRPPSSPNKDKDKGKDTSNAAAASGTQVEDERVTAARLAGTIPADAEVSTSDHEGDAEADTAPMTDDAYLDTFAIRNQLTVATRRIFDVSALGYRDIADARRDFITDHLAPAVKYAEVIAKEAGPYLGLLRWVLKKGDPSTWVICDSCNGSGEIGKGLGECPSCKRSGFHVR